MLLVLSGVKPNGAKSLCDETIFIEMEFGALAIWCRIDRTGQVLMSPRSNDPRVPHNPRKGHAR